MTDWWPWLRDLGRNLGARLESITKDYKSNIIISESTYALVKDHFVTKELVDVTVKGKTRSVKISAVLPDNIRKHPRATLAAAPRCRSRATGAHAAWPRGTSAMAAWRSTACRRSGPPARSCRFAAKAARCPRQSWPRR